jgi:spore germination protein KC
MRKAASIALLASMLLLGGCWSIKELNDISVVIGMGIDQGDENYTVTLQVVDPSQMYGRSPMNRSPIIIVSERADTLFEALRKMTTKAPRRMYGGHLRILILGEKVAREGLGDVLDMMLRDPEVRPDFNIAIAKNVSARDLLATMTPFESLTGEELHKSLQTSEASWAPTAAISIVDFYRMLSNEGVEPVLTGIRLIGNISKGQKDDNVKQPAAYSEYKYEGIGVMRRDKLIGWLSETDSKAYNYITNNVKSTVGSAICPSGKGRFVVEVQASNSKIVPIVKNGKPSVKIITHISGNIAENSCMLDLALEENFLALQQVGKEKAVAIISNGVQHVQSKYGVDIFGFGRAFHYQHPREWREWKGDWDNTFKRLPVEVELHYKLSQLGSIASGFGSKLNKEE